MDCFDLIRIRGEGLFYREGKNRTERERIFLRRASKRNINAGWS